MKRLYLFLKKKTLWIIPNLDEEKRIRYLLKITGRFQESDFYLAPQYFPDSVQDATLLMKVESTNPELIIICIGGGKQEPLGWYLKQNMVKTASILCTGAAISFLTGSQAKIPLWADRWMLSWWFRILDQPFVFGKRYFKAISLPLTLLFYSYKLRRK